MESPALTAEKARKAIEAIEAQPPFVRDPFGADAFMSSLRHLQELLGSVYLSDPAVFWAVMASLSALAAGLALHIAWSLVVLYRSVARGSEPARAEASERDFIAEAQRARVAGQNARAIQLCWFALCTRFGIPLSDTPGRQTAKMARYGNGASLRRFRELHERALYSGARPDDEDVRRAFSLLEEAGTR